MIANLLQTEKDQLQETDKSLVKWGSRRSEAKP
jgi:hypothetical protein